MTRPREEVLMGLFGELDGQDRRQEGYDSTQRAEILEAMANPEGEPVALDDLDPDPLDRDGEYLS